MKITYAITVADEEKEFKKLYETLRINKREEDNILVLVDETKCPRNSEFHDFLLDLHKAQLIKLISGEFSNDYSLWKNKLKNHPMIGDYAVFLDADELLPPQFIDDLPMILELNPDVDVFGLPIIGRNDYKYCIFKNISEIYWGVDKLDGSNKYLKLPQEMSFSIMKYKNKK